jgi:transposase
MERYIQKNKNGGAYAQGQMYGLETKARVAMRYMEMVNESTKKLPSVAELARECKVGWDYARRVVAEIHSKGSIIQPDVIRSAKNKHCGVNERVRLTLEEELFLLILRIEIPNRSNLDYISNLHRHHNKIVSSTFISQWFKRRFNKKGTFKKPNLVPLDKFRKENIVAYIEFREKVATLPDRTKYHFIDEKHIVNSNVYPKKVRADPFSGRADCVKVSGNFRDALNLLCIASADPTKPYPLEYTLGSENGCSTNFMVFIEHLLQVKWFKRQDIVILDNAAIHTGGQSDILEDLLWSTKGEDGEPLNILVLFLPTRSPELNPIELVFNILAKKLRSFNYSNARPDASLVVRKTTTILNEFPTDMFIRCCTHCGYFGRQEWSV